MAYITDELVVKRAKAAVKLALEKNQALDVPSIIYDEDTRIIYEVYSDGTRKAVSEPLEDIGYVG